MNGVGPKPLGVLFCCLLAATLPSCANSRMPSWIPFRDKPDHLAGVSPPAERTASLKKLAQNGPSTPADEKARISQDLVTQIKNEADPLIRAEIIRALVHYPSPAGDAVLRAAVNDPDGDVRVIACDCWGKRGDAQAVQVLSGLLTGDINVDVRLAAARALGKTRDPAAIAALAAALDDNDVAMQHRAVRSLQDITGESLGNDVDRWRQYAKEGRLKPANPSSLTGRIPRFF